MTHPFPDERSEAFTDLWHECCLWCESKGVQTGTLVQAIRFTMDFAAAGGESNDWPSVVKAVISTGKF